MDTLEQEICNCAERSGFSGVIRISGGDKLVFKGAWGFRNRAEQLPVGAATRFAIASGTKLFTALAIGRLVQQGRLALDSAVGDLHPDFRGWIDPAATIEQLLTHSSGCYDYLDEETIEDYENFRVDIPWCYLETPLDYLPLFVGQAMKAAAGSGYCYSNGGYVALGILIEMLSGRLYRDFVRDEVLLPAGMHDSGFFAFDELPSDTALGYLNDGLRTNIYKVPLRGGGDGGMYTTAPDLERFWKALLAGKILESPLLDAWLRPRLQIANQYWSACGLTRRTDNDSYSIVGGDHGVGFDSRYLPRSGITLSIFSNQSDGEEEMRELILELLG
ncbi:MAG: beta-lactamase family protein [Spirochaetes bacterium]|nr:beta-lactamase family protein [Spirochaetota bacterium]MBU0954448.1 beta-lactamase family protein [Spirochaetota bacterium]